MFLFIQRAILTKNYERNQLKITCKGLELYSHFTIIQSLKKLAIVCDGKSAKTAITALETSNPSSAPTRRPKRELSVPTIGNFSTTEERIRSKSFIQSFAIRKVRKKERSVAVNSATVTLNTLASVVPAGSAELPTLFTTALIKNFGILPDNASANPTAEISILNACTFEKALIKLFSIAFCIPNNPPVMESTDFIKENAIINDKNVEIKPKRH